MLSKHVLPFAPNDLLVFNYLTDSCTTLRFKNLDEMPYGRRINHHDGLMPYDVFGSIFAERYENLPDGLFGVGEPVRRWALTLGILSFSRLCISRLPSDLWRCVTVRALRRVAEWVCDVFGNYAYESAKVFVASADFFLKCSNSFAPWFANIRKFVCTDEGIDMGCFEEMVADGSVVSQRCYRNHCPVSDIVLVDFVDTADFDDWIGAYCNMISPIYRHWTHRGERDSILDALGFIRGVLAGDEYQKHLSLVRFLRRAVSPSHLPARSFGHRLRGGTAIDDLHCVPRYYPAWFRVAQEVDGFLPDGEIPIDARGPGQFALSAADNASRQLFGAVSRIKSLPVVGDGDVRSSVPFSRDCARWNQFGVLLRRVCVQHAFADRDLVPLIELVDGAIRCCFPDYDPDSMCCMYHGFDDCAVGGDAKALLIRYAVLFIICRYPASYHRDGFWYRESVTGPYVIGLRGFGEQSLLMEAACRYREPFDGDAIELLVRPRGCVLEFANDCGFRKPFKSVPPHATFTAVAIALASGVPASSVAACFGIRSEFRGYGDDVVVSYYRPRVRGVFHASNDDDNYVGSIAISDIVVMNTPSGLLPSAAILATLRHFNRFEGFSDDLCEFLEVVFANIEDLDLDFVMSDEDADDY